MFEMNPAWPAIVAGLTATLETATTMVAERNLIARTVETDVAVVLEVEVGLEWRLWLASPEINAHLGAPAVWSALLTLPEWGEVHPTVHEAAELTDAWLDSVLAWAATTAPDAL